MSEAAPTQRLLGLTVPLFSLRTAHSWGIGEVLDLVPFAKWVAESGVRLVQILPLGEIAASETSPYSALSAFGIDPMYLSLHAVPELRGEDLRSVLGGDVGLAALRYAQSSARVDYDRVRFAKERALARAWERFREEHLAHDSARGRAFAGFVTHARHWLEDYALFRALKDLHKQEPWWKWPLPLRERHTDAIDRVRSQLKPEVQRYRFLQFLAHEQWGVMRAGLREAGVQLMGDLPFIVGRDSADVWANQREFRHDMNVGAPPDQFNEEGQDWGLPPYRWEAMRANDFAWLRRRARYAGSLYDRFRVDHLIGFYRTYLRPIPTRDDLGRLRPGRFDPAEERAQLAHGARVLSAMRDAAAEQNARVIAEDLGIIPDPVRASMAQLGVPGYKVLIWEKDGEVFRDPRRYAARSVACYSTHDTDTMAAWWVSLEAPERAAVLRMMAPMVSVEGLGAGFTPAVHKALLEVLFRAPSELALLLLQDVLGTQDRINTPATTGPHNWSWRLPVNLEKLRERPEVVAAMAQLRACLQSAGR